MADRFPRFLAYSRQEPYKEPSPTIRCACPEGVAEKIEAGVLRMRSAVAVFAVQDLRLIGVQLKAQGPEPGSDSGPKVTGLFLVVAMGNYVICLCRIRHRSA